MGDVTRIRLELRLPVRILIAAGLGLALVGVRGAGPATIAALYVAAVTVPLGAVDARERRLPDALVLPGYAFAVIGICWEMWTGGPMDGPMGGAAPAWLSPLASAAMVVALLGALSAGGSLGMGDVKLAGLLAMALTAVGGGAAGGAPGDGAVAGADPVTGADPVVGVGVWLVAAFLAAALHAVIEWVASRGESLRNREIAFGPALLGSFWTVILTV
jgi:leader peptidase (prepilin peptidase)/N-methyltransferase